MKTIILFITIISSTCFGQQSICDLNTTDWNSVYTFWNSNYRTNVNSTDTDSITLVLSNAKSYIVCEFGETDSTLWVMSIYTNDKAIMKMITGLVKEDEWVDLYGEQKGLLLNCPKDVFLVKEKPENGYKWSWTVYYDAEQD